MLDENSQAATVAGQQQQAPIPGQSTDQVSAQQEPQKEQPLTLEAIRELVKTEATRIAQSQVAKGETRINRRIQEQLTALNVNREVLGLSDEQVAQAKQRIIVSAYDDAEEPQEPTPPQSQAPTASQPAPVDKFLADVFAEAGTQVTPNDPEWRDLQAVLDRTWNDPQGLPKVLVAATKAANAKAQRTAAMQETAPARVGGGGTTTTGAAPAASAAELWQAAYNGKK